MKINHFTYFSRLNGSPVKFQAKTAITTNKQKKNEISDEITENKIETCRKLAASKLGLSEDSTWEEIEKKAKEILNKNHIQ